jgi:polyhydroxyalkanoate synthesis regulator protein
MRPDTAYAPTLIKRYGGRRLYDTVRMQYRTHDDLAEMTLRGARFVVRDADTGEDLTRAVLDTLE